MGEVKERPVPSDFGLASCQAILFTAPAGFSAFDVVGWLSHAGSMFDGERSLPGDFPGLPPEVPRILMASRGQKWRAQIGPGVCNVTWNPSDGADDSLSPVLKEAAQFLFAYHKHFSAKVLRTAVVVSRFVVQDKPGLTLSRHFCKERWDTEPLNRPESFELHAHKSYELANTMVNSWFRAKSGFHEKDGGARSPIVIVEQDLNTVDQSAELPTTKVFEFFKAVPKEMDLILGQYFPESL